MKRLTVALLLCLTLFASGAFCAFASSSPPTTTTPETTAAPQNGPPQTTREQDIAIVVCTGVAIIGMVTVLLEKAKKNKSKKSPLRKD